MPVLETIEKIDADLFLFLNGKHNSFFDSVFYFASQTWTWIPLYAFFAYLVVKKYGKKCWVPLLGAVLLVAATDRSSTILKKSIKRYRPSHNIELKEKVHIIGEDKGGKYSFVSSHAANTFGIAVYLLFLIRPRKKYFAFLLLFWAAFVSYGRIYGGLHYPADILGGALLGSLIAFLVFRLQSAILTKYFHFS